MRTLGTAFRLFTALAIGACAAASAAAQAWPERPVRLIIPFAAGATNDIVGRLIATRLAPRLGQPVVAENRTGSGGTIGADAVAKSRPDGYTLLLGNLSTMVIAPLMYEKLPYSPERDFTQVATVASAPLVLAVHPSLPVRSVAELVAHARANAGKLNFASPGNGTPMHLMGESLKLQGGLEMTHVAYRGGAPAVVDLLANTVQLMFDNLTSLKPHVDSGALRAIAVTSSRRMAALPDVPTVAESGFPALESTSWFTIAAPKGTPPDVVARLEKEIAALVQEDEYVQRLATVGTEPLAGGSDAADRLVRRDAARWAEIVKRSGARVQ